MTANTNCPPQARIGRVSSAAFLTALERMGRSYHGGAAERAAQTQLTPEGGRDTPDTEKATSGPENEDEQ